MDLVQSLTDAIRAAYAAVPFSPAIAPRRVVDPNVSLEAQSAGNTPVDVVLFGRTRTEERVGRDVWDETLEINLAVLRKVAAASPEAIDHLTNLTEDLRNFFRRPTSEFSQRHGPQLPVTHRGQALEAKFLGAVNGPTPFNLQHLIEAHHYTGTFTLRFVVSTR